MNDAQASLVGFDAPPAPTDRLFFGLFPNPSAVSQARELALRLKAAWGLRAKPHLDERMHITLHHIGDFAGLPGQLVADACRAAASLSWPAFEVRLDHVASFAGRRAHLPLVVLGREGVAELKAFQQSLDNALKRAAVVRGGTKPYTPHLTLLYDDVRVPEHDVEPIHWIAREFVLVHSFLGRSRYEILGRWPLGAVDSYAQTAATSLKP